MHSEHIPHPAALSAQEPSRQDMKVILIMLIATFTVILNETIMNVALPKLMSSLQISASTAQWLTTSYMLVMAVLIPTTGFLIQRFTTRTLFLAAMGVFSLGTLTAALAPSFPVLLLGRIFQASGTAIMLPLLTTAILGLIPPHRRGTMMGTVSIVISVAPAIGPTISGIILENLSWRYMFFFMLPIVIGVLIFGARSLTNIGEVRESSLDVPSVFMSGLGFGGIVYGFSSAAEHPWSSTLVWLPLLVGFISLGGFVWRQLRLDAPLLDLRAFRYPMFRLSVAMMMMLSMALFASALLLPIYLQNIRQFTPLQTGLLLLPGGVLMGIASPIVGRIFDRYGPRVLAPLGAGILILMLWQFTTIDAQTPGLKLLILHSSFNLGLALLFTPVFTTGLNQLPRALYSHGSAIASTFQQVAGAIGTALLVTVMSLGTQSFLLNAPHSTDPLVQRAALNAGLHSAFAVAGILATLTLLLGLFLRRSSPPTEEGAFEEEAGQPAFATH